MSKVQVFIRVVLVIIISIIAAFALAFLRDLSKAVCLQLLFILFVHCNPQSASLKSITSMVLCCLL